MAKQRQKPEPGSEGYPEYEDKSFQQMKDLAIELRADYRDRNIVLDELEQYYTMMWKNPIPKDSNQTAVTYDTDMTNRFMGAWRLLTATEPEFSVPTDQNSPDTLTVSSPMEKAAKIMWAASGKQGGMPLEKEAVHSALSAGQVDILLSNLIEGDQPDEPAPDEDDVSYWRRKNAEAKTPIYFEVSPVRNGYALRAKYGLQAYARIYETTVAKFREEWADVDTLAFLVGKKALEPIRVIDCINEQFRYAWLDGDERPFYAYENKSGIVPVISQVTEGSLLLNNPSLQARPFLYTAHKSNLPRQKSMALTAIYTIIKSVAMSATWKHKRSANDPHDLRVRQLGPLSVYELEQDEDIQAMLSTGAIDPAILTALEIANQQIAESTIYSQALGEPLGANAPFSMVALLHQAGRLPLTAPKVLTGWAIASAMELAFLWLKATGKDLHLSSMGQQVTVKAAEIPIDVQFEAKLEIDLPQDIREVAGVVGAFEGKVSNRWIRENLMKGVGQSEAMQEEIWSEQAAAFFFQQQLAMFAQIQQQASQGGGDEADVAADPRARLDTTRQRPSGKGPRVDDATSRNQQPTPREQSFEPYAGGKTQAE